MVMNAFRRSVVADTKKKGGKSKGVWYDKFRLPQTQPGAPFVLVRAEHVDPSPSPEQVEVDPATGRPKPVVNPYFKYRVHKRKLMQGGKEWFADEICSAGIDAHNPQPCVGCFAVDSGDKSIGVSDSFAFSIVHLAYYHGHPLLDREKGGIVMKNDNSGPVMVTTECEGRTCNFCRVLQGQPPLPPQPGKDPWPGFDPRTLTTTFGKRRYLDMGKGHLSDLEGIDQVISAQCGNCRSQLTTDGFACPHCNTTIIDMANDPRSDEQIAQDVVRPYPCMRCQRPVLLKEVVSCESCASQNAQALQLSLFDVVIFGMRQGEGTKSHITQGLPHKTIEEFARSIDPSFLGGKTMRDYIAEMAKPYNFEELFQPRSLQDQSARLKLPMPGGMGAQPGYAQGPGFQQQMYAPAQNIQQPAQMYQQPQMMAPLLQPGQPQFAAYPGAPVQYAPQPQMAPQQPAPQAGPAPFVPIMPPNFGKQ
jgi:DNA-directed RNA polymerase subunit RPC12/RpoP